MPVQKLVYVELISPKHCYNLHGTIERRLTKLFQPFSLDFNHLISLNPSLQVLKGNGVADVLKVLKSWCNGWATSNRYHEDIRLPFLFGCNNCSDDMRHYLQCPHLHALQKFMIPATSEDPLIRWSLINPCKESFQQIACAQSGHHAVRRPLKSSDLCPCNNMTNFESVIIRASWKVFADAFQAEARELNVNTFKFSVPSFSNSSTTGSHPNRSSNGPSELGNLLPSPSEQSHH